VLEQINGGLGVQGKCGREEEWQVTGSFDHPLPVLEPGSSFSECEWVTCADEGGAGEHAV
jgi:hypothetical protein